MPEKAETDESKGSEKSRLQRLKDEKKDERYAPSMPPLDCGAHVLDYLWDWGPTLIGSMGDGPLTHAEIRACQENTGIELSSWEASTLMRLSKDYFAESHRATKRDCKAPWQDGSEAQTLIAVDTRDALRALAKL